MPRHYQQGCANANNSRLRPDPNFLDLRKLPFVDPKRIVLGGYSWGAMVGALASSKRWGASLAPTNRFLATVSFYQ
jgi:dienelactone hydrolase